MTNWVSPSSQNMNSGYQSHIIILSYTISDFWKALKEPIFVAQISQITDLQGTC